MYTEKTFLKKLANRLDGVTIDTNIEHVGFIVTSSFSATVIFLEMDGEELAQEAITNNAKRMKILIDIIGKDYNQVVTISQEYRTYDDVKRCAYQLLDNYVHNETHLADEVDLVRDRVVKRDDIFAQPFALVDKKLNLKICSGEMLISDRGSGRCVLTANFDKRPKGKYDALIKWYIFSGEFGGLAQNLITPEESNAAEEDIVAPSAVQ